MVDAGAGGAPQPQPSDSGAGGAPATGCTLFCEDFEAPDLDRTRWSIKTAGGNTVTLQTERVAHGTRAVKFHANANTNLAMLFSNRVPPELARKMFGRAYFYVTPEPPSGHTAFFTAGTMDGYPYSDDHLEISSYRNTWQLGFWGNGEIISAGGKIPLARWACIEWEFDAEKAYIVVYVDGQRQHSIAAGSGKIKAFTDVAFGFRSWHPASFPIDIYMDDIALGATRVGCLK